jgi:hypothetical protein
MSYDQAHEALQELLATLNAEVEAADRDALFGNHQQAAERLLNNIPNIVRALAFLNALLPPIPKS